MSKQCPMCKGSKEIRTVDEWWGDQVDAWENAWSIYGSVAPYMKAFCVLLLGIVLGSSCGCSKATPVTPEPDGNFIQFWDDPAPPGWMPDGTQMDRTELVIYFAAHYTECLSPPSQECAVYNFWHAYFDALYERPYLFMRWYEGNECDVPDENDAEEPC